MHGALAARALAALTALAAPQGPALAPEPPTTDPAALGAWLAAEAERRGAGWRTEQARLALTLIDPEGIEGEARVFALTRVESDASDGETPPSDAATASGGDVERSLVEVLEPARHHGFRVLTVVRTDGDEVWVRLPAHRQTRRIVGTNRSGGFLGSDLTYEDLVARRAGRYSHRWLRDEPLGGVPCRVVEATPRDGDSAYARLVLWRDARTLAPLRIEYHDADPAGSLVKVATLRDYAPHGPGAHLRPTRLEVENVRTHRRTRVVARARTLGAPLPPDAVTRRGLER